MDNPEIFGEITQAASAINGGLTALSNLIGTGKGRAELAEAMNQLITLRQLVLDLQSEHSALRDTMREREAEIQRIKAFRKEAKDEYELYSPDRFASVYRLKTAAEDSGHANWLCALCFERDQKSPLQPLANLLDRFLPVTWRCGACDSAFQLPSHLHP